MKIVLVTGCPRSGTTAAVSWLLTSPGVRGSLETRRTVVLRAMLREARRFRSFVEPVPTPGEPVPLERLGDAIRVAARALYGDHDTVIDKEPLEPIAFPAGDYREYVDDMARTLDAQIVFMIRHPLATISSMLQRRWGYSLVGFAPETWAYKKCLDVWRANARIAIRRSTDLNTHVQFYEALMLDGGARAAAFAGLNPPEPFHYHPSQRPLAPGLDTLTVLRDTAWERELLGHYDSRPETHSRVVLLTGEPGTGKTTIARDIEAALRVRGVRVVVLDGDELREELWPDLGYDNAGRAEAVRRATTIATHLAASGTIVIVAMVAPVQAVRATAQLYAMAARVPFRVVRVTASVELRRKRRPDDRVHALFYEEPPSPNLVIDTGTTSLGEASQAVLRLL